MWYIINKIQVRGKGAMHQEPELLKRTLQTDESGISKNSNQLNNVKEEKKTRYVKWNEEQNQKYVNFLEENYDSFKNQYKRRSLKVFHQMAEMIPKRTPEQCRSHHQKLMQRYGNVDHIIHSLMKRRQVKKLKKSIKKTSSQKVIVQDLKEEKEEKVEKEVIVEEMNENITTSTMNDTYESFQNLFDYELENIPQIEFQFNQNDSEIYIKGLARELP